jgi:hypothetical protein
MEFCGSHPEPSMSCSGQYQDVNFCPDACFDMLGGHSAILTVAAGAGKGLGVHANNFRFSVAVSVDCLTSLSVAYYEGDWLDLGSFCSDVLGAGPLTLTKVTEAHDPSNPMCSGSLPNTITISLA